MKEYFSKKLNNIKNDSVLKYGWFVSLAMLICQAWMYYDSKFMVQPLIRCIFFTLLLFTIPFFGRSGIFNLSIIFAYAITPDIRFTNFTPFLIILFNMMIRTKSNKIKQNLTCWISLLLPYIILVFVACERHDKSASQLVYHFLGCFIFFIGDWFFVRNKKNLKPLILDPDQEKILHDLASGKMQKEIDYFSKNTVTDKIKTAIENNGCLTKEQLLMRYIASNSEFN